jgi:hypothetical protein
MPPKVSAELQAETRRREAQAVQGLIDENRWQWVQDFNRDLERVWPGMRLVWCPDPAPVDAVAMGARPGRWGILRPSQTGGPGSVKPLLGENDEFVEPGGWVFDMLREQDWWNPEVRRERERVQREAKLAAERRKQVEREEADQEVLERYLAGTRAFVSMDRSRPWSQNVAGRRGAKKSG